MTEAEFDKVMDGIADGLNANEILQGSTNGPGLLRQVRAKLGEKFRPLMRGFIIPNRIGRSIETLDYIETAEEIDALEKRVQEAIAALRSGLVKE